MKLRDAVYFLFQFMLCGVLIVSVSGVATDCGENAFCSQYDSTEERCQDSSSCVLCANHLEAGDWEWVSSGCVGVQCSLESDVCYKREILHCVGCPIGSYYDARNETHGQCRSCPRNMTTLNDTQFDVLHCECGLGYEPDESRCNPCQYGFYKELPGNHSCTGCPLDSTTLIEEAVSIDACLCEAGFTVEEIGHECTPCDAGMSKGIVSDVECVTCPAHTYCPQQSSFPTNCQHNSSAPPGSSVLEDCTCNPGFEANGIGVCQSCGVGEYNEVQDSSCLLCAPDTYNPVTALDDIAGCLSCPQNASSSDGSSLLTQCLCDAGFSGEPGQQCTACDVGFYRSDMNEYICTACPEDTYNDVLAAEDVAACRTCPINTESRAGSGESIACVCTAGFHFNASQTSESAYSCVECKEGFYQPDANSSQCIACEPGLFSTERAASHAAVCTKCADGSYSLEPGSSACEQCENGKYQNISVPGVTAEECTPCPLFSTHGLLGSVSRQECICDIGYYAVDKNSDGYFCRECEPGFYCPGDGVRLDCALNHYSTSGAAECVECAENSFGLRIHHRDQCLCLAGSEGTFDDNCTQCPVGSAQPTNFSGSDCQPCVSDLYQDEVGQRFCKECAGNSSTEGSTGVVSVAGCSCDPGFFGPSEGPCEVCIAGTFCPGGDAVLSCRQHSHSLPGSDTQEDCKCVRTFYSTEAGGVCNRCDRGFFCGGDLSRERCAGNSSSVVGTGVIEGCICDAGMWRGCIITDDGQLDADGEICEIDYSLPCRNCDVDNICVNNTLRHCPDSSAAPRGSDHATDCICDDGFFRVFS